MKSPDAEQARETRKLEAKRGEFLKEKLAISVYFSFFFSSHKRQYKLSNLILNLHISSIW